MPTARLLKHALAALVAVTLGLATQAQAFCGFFAGKADAGLFNEASQVILVRDGPRTVISMLNDFKGPLTEFALVVPVPQVLQRGQVRIGDKKLFERLDAYSAPRLAEYFDPDPCPAGQLDRRERHGLSDRLAMSAAPAPMAAAAERAKALGVAVEASYTVGEYDIVMLSAKQSQGLEIWLNENGYRMPRGAAAALKPYVALDMKFFVAKVNVKEQANSGVQYLRPLQFAFESEKFMLPLRLGMINAEPNKPQDLIAYVLTRGGRVESSNYRTVKLPANLNLPAGVKRDFKTFYKAMFDHQAKQEEHRVVFTEYFWDMAWCDPCAADPLRPEELRSAGVFWLADEAVAEAVARPRGMQNGAQNALLTRLHVRYTPATFPEDLMFVQTQDRQNWQTRYVLQHPHPGSMQQCREKAAAFDCENACAGGGGRGDVQACVQSCRASQQASVEQARRYFETDLPRRQREQAATLMRVTGWNADEARRYAGVMPIGDSPAQPDVWWQRLFGKERP